ncbi:MAG: hypothetical protein ABI543_02990 [Ignavibacteria bacterium]
MAKTNQPKTVLSSKNTSIISVAESLLKDAGILYSVSMNGITEIQVTGEENIFNARKILIDLEELDFHDKNQVS